eukprot:9392864-Pyramimonas_sp.AAC.1
MAGSKRGKRSKRRRGADLLHHHHHHSRANNHHPIITTPQRVLQFRAGNVPRFSVAGFSSSKALSTHRMKIHGHRNPVASVILVGATTCPACSKVSGTTQQLLDHA